MGPLKFYRHSTILCCSDRPNKIGGVGSGTRNLGGDRLMLGPWEGRSESMLELDAVGWIERLNFAPGWKVGLFS